MLGLSAGPLAGTAAAAPIPVTAPTLSSTNAFVGETLSVSQGTYVDGNVTSDQWERCDPSMNCTATGTDGLSYTVTYADVGDTLKVAETATSPTDGMTTEQDSNQTSVVPGPPTNTTPPVIAGSPPPVVGNTLTATQGTWSSADAGSITDTWERCDGASCSPIPGTATTTPTTSYTLTSADAGHTIEVMETATNGGTPANRPVFSQATATVVAGVPVPDPTNPPAISGTPVQGQTLSASPGAFSNTPSSYTYQWSDCGAGGTGCTPIPGATGSTYTLTAGDVGARVVVSVSGVNVAGTGSAALSAPTAAVQTPSTVSLTAAPGAPVTNQGVTLAATVTARAASGAPAGSMAFLDQGRPISGCEAQPVTASGQSVTVLCQTSFAAESAQLTATFTPGAGSLVLGSSSAAAPLAVGPDTTTTNLDASATVPVHAPTTFTATVAPTTTPGGPIKPSGTVQFLDGTTPIAGCGAQPLVGGGATCTITYVATGSHSITARYLGDANFAASTATSRVVRVTALAAKGTITATMQWTFQYAPAYTRVINMVINGVPTGATVQMLCHGHGCPFAKRSRTIAKAKPCSRAHKHSCPIPGQIDLTSTFRHRKLGPGAQITIEIRRPRFIGKYYSFTVRPRQQPRVRIACLPVGSNRPASHC